MPNRNIYFTAEQVVEMQKFPQNWSRICQEAVDQKLKELRDEIAQYERYKEINALML